MIRSELIASIAKENPDLSLDEATRIVDAFFRSITEGLANGQRVELRGFGVFSTKERDARKGRNPRTGERVDVESKRAVAFKTGKPLLLRMNPDLSQGE